MTKAIRSNGVVYVAVTPARLEALRLSIAGIDTWLSEFTNHPHAKQDRAKRELERMIAEAEGDTE